MMYQCRISNSISRATVVLDETTTIREAFEEANINPVGLLSVDGLFIKATDIDLPISSFNPMPEKPVWISCCTKTENACDVTVLGSAVVVKPSISVEDIKLLEKYDPDALKLFVGAENEVTFRIASGEVGELSTYGAVVPATGVINITIPAGYVTPEDRKTFVIENLGASITSIREIETYIRENNLLTNVRSDLKALESSINFID